MQCTQPKLTYQQTYSKTQEPNQYIPLSRVDALPDFNKSLNFFQLTARKLLRNPISYSCDKKSNKIFKREMQADKMNAKIFEAVKRC